MPAMKGARNGAVIRKLVTLAETTEREMGRPIAGCQKAAAAAIIANPCAGRYVEDLSELIDIGAAMGDLLTREALALMRVEPSAIQSYGKAALVGENGELEHAAALLHPALGAPLRAVLGGGAALVPSSKATGGPGSGGPGFAHWGERVEPHRRPGGANLQCSAPFSFSARTSPVRA